MRQPTYLSPSQLALWEINPEEYYLQHLAEIRAPRIPQADYMSIGSSFDAYVKSAMHEVIFGKNSDPRFEFDTIFSEQVEEHNRDWAREHGKYVFECYKVSGAYDDLLQMIQESECAPQFETKISGMVDGIPLLGKPDLRFINKFGAHIILDWKVNGYCSKSAISPYKNYRLCRDGWTEAFAKASTGAGQSHKNYTSVTYKGVEMYTGFLEEASESWADQLAIYAWILGEPVGDESVIFCIDQIVAKPKLPHPLLRVANHRARISRIFQQVLIGRLHDAWNRITSGHIFKEMSREDNDARCAVLDQQAITNYGVDDWINQVSRKVGF